MNGKLTRIVGKNISSRRKYRELTQAKLAEHCHCDRSTISRFERGKKSPTVEHLEIIASALDIDIISLLSEDHLRSDLTSLTRISGDLDALAAYYSSIEARIRLMEESDKNTAIKLERILEFFHHIF